MPDLLGAFLAAVLFPLGVAGAMIGAAFGAVRAERKQRAR
jgi:hypothetical protein